MKKFLIILCVLVMIPLYSFAAKSPIVQKTVICDPELMYVFAEKTKNWHNVLKRLETVDTEGFILLEAVQVCLDKKCGKIEWTLPIKITSEHEPFVLIIDSEAIVKQEVPTTTDGHVIIDFTDYEPNIYYVCFYIKGA